MVGEGGGSGASVGDAESADAGRLKLVELRRLPTDLSEAASDLSSAWASADVEARGLSVLRIFDRIDPRKDRRDSLVSDLENEGYDCSESPAPELPLE
jgi:hypothetical protein